MSLDDVISAFELQARWCDEMGSPFTASLMRSTVTDMKAGGPAADVLGDWPGHPIADALMMRFAGALHAASLTRRDEELAALYPGNTPSWNIGAIWPVARAFLAREQDWVRAFLQSPPQTNETRRAIAMLPGFLALARHGPLHLLEIGASAGLNQNWEKFHYQTANWSWGNADGPSIDTEWRGAAPANLGARPVIASRAACDRNPLDVRDSEHVLRLRAYIWADQTDRALRLERAMRLARDAGTRVEKADAAAWLADRLAGDAPIGTTLIYHSVVWQYLPAQTRDAITAIIENAGARATAERRIAWLRCEPVRMLGYDGPIDHMAVELRTWPGSERRLIARTDGHARWVELA